MVNSYVGKPERLALSKMWTSIFCLSKGAYMTTSSGQSAWGIWIEFNFRCLKWFFRKLPWKVRPAFLIKLRFLKLWLSVTRRKYLVQWSLLLRSPLLTRVADLGYTVCNATKSELLTKGLNSVLKFTKTFLEVISNWVRYKKFADL